jgi:RNA polymerase primary sigma factor
MLNEATLETYTEDYFDFARQYQDDPALLTEQEETALVKRVQQSDTRAMQHLLKTNLPLVIRLAREYQGQGLPLMNLVTIGNLALLEAAKYHQISAEKRFILCAAILVRQRMQQALASYHNTSA